MHRLHKFVHLSKLGPSTIKFVVLKSNLSFVMKNLGYVFRKVYLWLAWTGCAIKCLLLYKRGDLFNWLMQNYKFSINDHYITRGVTNNSKLLNFIQIRIWFSYVSVILSWIYFSIINNASLNVCVWMRMYGHKKISNDLSFFISKDKKFKCMSDLNLPSTSTQNEF